MRKAAIYLENLETQRLTPSDFQADLFYRIWKGIDLDQPYSWIAETDPFDGQEVIGLEKTSLEFRQELAKVAQRLGIAPIWLAAIISFETAGTFSPSIKNFAGSGATGLIQFMPSTAQRLGTSTEALAKMSAVEQLQWVEKYFTPYRGRLKSLEDCYMAVLWPGAIGRSPNHVLFEHPTIAYQQNAGLDLNRDGKITVAEATQKVRERILTQDPNR